MGLLLSCPRRPVLFIHSTHLTKALLHEARRDSIVYVTVVDAYDFAHVSLFMDTLFLTILLLTTLLLTTLLLPPDTTLARVPITQVPLIKMPRGRSKKRGNGPAVKKTSKAKKGSKVPGPDNPVAQEVPEVNSGDNESGAKEDNRASNGPVNEEVPKDKGGLNDSSANKTTNASNGRVKEGSKEKGGTNESDANEGPKTSNDPVKEEPMTKEDPLQVKRFNAIFEIIGGVREGTLTNMQQISHLKDWDHVFAFNYLLMHGHVSIEDITPEDLAYLETMDPERIPFSIRIQIERVSSALAVRVRAACQDPDDGIPEVQGNVFYAPRRAILIREFCL